MLRTTVLLFICLALLGKGAAVFADDSARLLPGFIQAEMGSRLTPDERVRDYLLPNRVMWESEVGVNDSSRLLEPVLGQTSTAEMQSGCVLEKKGDKPAAILLDFGREIQGGIRIESRDLTPAGESVGKSVRVRVRFGESADEAMVEPGEKGAIIEHSTRDMIVNVPWLGAIEFGESAFRFARLDLVDSGSRIVLDSVRAVLVYRNLPWIGTFSSSDDRLDNIWNTAAWTQFLNMQTYIFEGAKRDRLVWYGDIHPQAMTTMYLTGCVPVLKETLGSYPRATWALPAWMNGMPNYSLWWIISVGDLYLHDGDAEYVREQLPYLKGLVDQLLPYIKENGQGAFENPFLDWPTFSNREALDAGTHAMFIIGMRRVKMIALVLGDKELAQKAEGALTRLVKYQPSNVGNKQAAALLAWAGSEKAGESNSQVLTNGGGAGFSTFYGYYMLEGLSILGENQAALDAIREYWGAMLDVGATTFWEDFDLNWLNGSGRIDELTPDGLKSLHGDLGAHCYVGFRHSLCHGWSSGPLPWMMRHILGVQPVEGGFKQIKFEPFLGDLDWAEGTIPTPNGPIHVRLDKKSDGSINKKIDLPQGVTIK